jgi:type I restriction enzyme M protein
MARKSYVKADEIQVKGNKIFSPVRQKWLPLTPEERVRQEYLRVLTQEYGYVTDQMAEEMDVTGRGSAQARADFVIWRSAQDKIDQKPPFIIVECKSDNVTIKAEDYAQGEHYARMTGAPFFVTHNSRETKYWRVKKDKMPGYIEEIENIPHVDATDKEIEELFSKLRVFKEKEFADLLHQCHNVIRNREKKDPAAAFDEIAKILFVKVYVERKLLTRRSKENLFTVDVLDKQIAENPLDNLFQETKKAYSTDKIFEDEERINLKPATGEEIVRKLEKYNLSDTSEDIKGVAFERFLGRTFRGEIGQFFTPRTIVEFMVHMIDPQEGEVVCDPASGSGGFLIRVFEIVREKILADADKQYNQFRKKIEKDKSLTDAKRAKLLQEKFDEIQQTIDQTKEGSRLWALANRCIFGTDANDRMARTSKMNMIMHGDGHGGVHHHDGFLNVNGIFETRFDIVLTNPPFGANVEPSDKVLESDIQVSDADDRRYVREFGEPYKEAYARVKAAINQPIAKLFELPPRRVSKGRTVYGKIKTEILFIERCLDLLKPGGRMGIVLPEGIYNNPSLLRVRQFVEDRAYLKAVVSLPQETFISSGASVKASLLFLQKYTDEEKERFDQTYADARAEIEAKYADEIEKETKRLEDEIARAKADKDADRRMALQKELREYLKQMDEKKADESRQLLKERFDYRIFMYEAEKVGISGTGGEVENELYPNPNQPKGVEKTCVEWYREFLADPSGFTVAVGGE